MLTSTQNSSNSILNIRVIEKISVKDVFGAFKRVVKDVKRQIIRLWAEFGPTIVLKMIFSGLNNHSSPPVVDFIAINSIKKDCARF